MIHKSQFGISHKDTFARTFFSNDWTHSIMLKTKSNDFTQEKPSKFKVMAKILISAQLGVSFAAVIRFNYLLEDQCLMTRSASVWALLISLMSLSNATKNQIDSFSGCMQSYWTKLHNSVFYTSLAVFGMNDAISMIIMGAFAMLLFTDFLVGAQLLITFFGKKQSNIEIVEGFLEESESRIVQKENYNSRLPHILESNGLMKKLFTYGWKLNLFNEMDQINKQLVAIAVILALFQFSIVDILMNGQNNLFSATVLCYSLISLCTFLNLTYVRDFDVLQVNIVPVTLAIIGINLLMQEGTSYALCGMTLTMCVDSFFALRSQQKTDVIEYTPIELLAMKSWTEKVFQADENMTLQLTATTIIFMQLFLSLFATASGSKFSIIIVLFYMTRLLQFIFPTNLGFQMAQSNMMCLLLAFNGLFHISAMCTIISTAIMFLDGYIGLYLFCTENKIEIADYINIDIAYFQKKFIMSRPSLRVNDSDISNDNDYEKI